MKKINNFRKLIMQSLNLILGIDLVLFSLFIRHIGHSTMFGYGFQASNLWFSFLMSSQSFIHTHTYIYYALEKKL